jgi:hypothetical protein
MARCPAHEDGSPSLSLTERDGRVLVHCHAGCEQTAVIDALRARGLWPERERRDWTAEERREWGRRRRMAEQEAHALIAWRARLLAAVRAARDAHLGAYHRALRYIIRHSLDSPRGLLAADVAEVTEARVDELQQALDQLTTASWEWWRDRFRTHGRRLAA